MNRARSVDPIGIPDMWAPAGKLLTACMCIRSVAASPTIVARFTGDRMATLWVTSDGSVTTSTLTVTDADAPKTSVAVSVSRCHPGMERMAGRARPFR